MQSQALIPDILQKKEIGHMGAAITVVLGVAFLSLLAQVSVRLPFTPVPITGQTLGVGLLAFACGRKLSLSIMLSYLTLGSLGAPVFASGTSGPIAGPTAGYLYGMLLAGFVIGFFADRGFARSFGSTLGVCFLGSICTFSCGLLGLSFYVPSAYLLDLGLLPFLPGDVLKTLLIASLSRGFYAWKSNSKAL